jgi:hypothetical protein
MFPVASIKRLVTRSLSGKWILVPVAAAALGLPTMAHADSRFDRGGSDRDSRWSDRRDNDRRDYDRHDNDYRRGGTKIDVDVRIGGRDRRPEYREREVRVWVPATYRTVVDRKWVEPVYRVECEQVWVPPVYEDRVVEFIGGHGRLRTRVERVLVCDGHFEKRERRVCVSEGHWENCERQVLVCAGHYETRIERAKIPYRTDPLVVVNPGLGGIWR